MPGKWRPLVSLDGMGLHHEIGRGCMAFRVAIARRSRSASIASSAWLRHMGTGRSGWQIQSLWFALPGCHSSPWTHRMCAVSVLSNEPSNSLQICWAAGTGHPSGYPFVILRGALSGT